jgi:hypothetical protein
MAKPRTANLRAAAQAKPIRPRYTNRNWRARRMWVKPDTGDELTDRSRQIPRGDWVQRAEIDQSRNLGGPVEEA